MKWYDSKGQNEGNKNRTRREGVGIVGGATKQEREKGRLVVVEEAE